MNIQYLIAMLEKRIAHLEQIKSSYEALGDIDQVESADVMISEVQATLAQLKTLL